MIDLDSAVFYSADMLRTIDFYQNKLGLKLEYAESKDDYPAPESSQVLSSPGNTTPEISMRDFAPDKAKDSVLTDGRELYFVSFIFPSGKKLGIRLEKGDRERSGHQTVFLSVNNIEKEFEKIKQSGGFNIYRKLENHSWGKAFAIMDPDNNKIEFIER